MMRPPSSACPGTARGVAARRRYADDRDDIPAALLKRDLRDYFDRRVTINVVELRLAKRRATRQLLRAAAVVVSPRE